MTKTYSIVEVTGGAFEVIATGLSWVEAMNQTMTLECNVGGSFREVAHGTTEEAFRARRHDNNICPVQTAWAYL